MKRHITVVAMASCLITTQVTSASPSRCEAAVTREIAFTAPGARDALDVSAQGPDCASSVVTVVIRKGGAQPVAAFAIPLLWLHETIDTSRPMLPDALKGLLQAYVTDAQVDAGGTTIPQWKKREPTPGFSQGLELTTPLDRKSYARLRAAKPNMLCLADAHDMGACYVWNAHDAKADVILRR
jgi:hypothetical protein